MKTLSPANKKKSARIELCNFSRFPQKLASSIPKTFVSLIGRDIKVWAQVAVFFILVDIVLNDELEVRVHLSNVRPLNKMSHFRTIVSFKTDTCLTVSHLTHFIAILLHTAQKLAR